MPIKKALLSLFFLGFLTLFPSRALASTAIFQQGANNYSGNQVTYLDRWNPDANQNGSGNALLRPDNQYAVLRFDLSSLSSEALVQNAVLKIFVVSRSNANPIITRLYPLLRLWNETEATWHKASNPSEWAWVGANGLYSDRLADPVTIQTLNSANTYYEYNLTALVRQWVRYPQTNFGLVIVPEGANVAYTLAAESNSDIVRRPQLTVDYSLSADNDFPPHIQITNPSNEAFLTGTVGINVNALDDRGIRQVNFLVDDSVVGASASSPYQFNWNTTNYSVGKHIFKAVAVDQANQTAQSTITVYLYRTDHGITTFAQITDTHFGTSAFYEPPDKSQYYANFTRALTELNSIVKPSVIVHAGDIATIFDNHSGNLYRSAVAQSAIPVIPIAGNHDLSYPENYLFYAGSFNKWFDLGQNRFIGYSTTKFNPGWIQGLLSSTSKKGIIFSHYLLRMPLDSTSDPGFFMLPEGERTALQSIMNTYQVSAYLSGHLHSSFILEDNVSHGLEIGGPDLGSKGQYNIVTIDNGIVSSQTVNLNDWPQAVVTSPHRYYPDGGTKEIAGSQKIRVKIFGDSPIVSVVSRLDETGYASSLTNLGNGVWEQTKDVSAKGGGLHKIIFQIVDAAGRSKTIEFPIKVRKVAPATVEYSFNSGGGAYNGHAADRAYTSGFSGFVNGSTFSTTQPIRNTNMPGLYQSERYGTHSYKFDLPSGNYQVILQFAEIYPGCQQINCRTFNVKIEGNQVLTNFDIFKQAGGYTAVDKVFSATVLDEQLNIDFITVQGNAKISAIKVTNQTGVINTPTPTPEPTQPPTVVTPTPTNGQPTPTPTIIPTPTTTPVITPTATPTPTPTPINNVNGLPIRINSGGPGFLNSTNQTWLADQSFSGGSLFSTTTQITNTTNPKVYQTERYNLSGYRISVPNGTRTIVLKFAEIYSGCQYINCRLFNIKIEGSQILTNFDVFKEAGGGYKAIDKTFTVNVGDNQLNIDFQAIKNTSKINGIEIY